MSTTTIERLRSSFALVAPHADEFVAEFYDDLFRRAPQIRALFPPDLTAQRGHLVGALTMVVSRLDDLPSLEAPLRELGRRHVRYGAAPEHYAVVRDALLATLARRMGDQWGPLLESEWRAALDGVARAMLAGAQRAERVA